MTDKKIVPYKKHLNRNWSNVENKMIDKGKII